MINFGKTCHKQYDIIFKELPLRSRLIFHMKKIIYYFWLPSKKFQIIKNINSFFENYYEFTKDSIIEIKNHNYKELTIEEYKKLTKEEKMNYFQQYVDSNKKLSLIDNKIKDTGLVATILFGIIGTILGVVSII